MSKRIRWVKFRTASGLIRAYWLAIAKERGVAASEIVISPEMASAVRRHRMWAFVSVSGDPTVVRYWHESTVSKEKLAMMLGHELGHATGKPKRGHVAEEDRADEYGRVAAAVWRRLSK